MTDTPNRIDFDPDKHITTEHLEQLFADDNN